MLVHGALFTTLATSIPFAASLANKGAFKLEIHKELSGTNACTFLSIIESQLHKGLRISEIVEDLPFRLANSGMDTTEIPSLAVNAFKFYSYQLPLLWQRAESLCGPPSSWEFETFIFTDSPQTITQSLQFDDVSTQFPLSSDYESLPTLSKTTIPNFDVVPLFTTGPSSNRLDITFFGDGCAS